MANKRILVCDTCMDRAFEHNRTILIPADPIPIANPRPEFFVLDDNPISVLSMDPLSAVPGTVLRGANIGNLTQGRGLDAPYTGALNKPRSMSALLNPSSSATTANWVAKNWSATPGLMPAYPPQLAGQSIGLRYCAVNFTAIAPDEQSFLGQVSARLTFSGWDGAAWHSLWSGLSAGTRGEQINVTSSQLADINPYYIHALSIFGDGINAAALATLQINANAEGSLASPPATPTAPIVSS